MNPRIGPFFPFGSVLKKLRTENNFTQAALAHSAGLDETYISLLERSQRVPSLEVLLKIAKPLNIKASDIIKIVENSIYSDPSLADQILNGKTDHVAE